MRPVSHLGIGGLVHDGNCCVLDESGQPFFIGEEERFSREKRRGGYPAYAITSLCKKYRCDLTEIKTIVLSRDELPPEKGLKSFVRPTPATEFIHVNHHLAHAAGTFFSSPFKNAAILTIDGLGDGACSLMAKGVGTHIEPLSSLHYLHSLGIIWMRTGWFLGFVEDWFFSGAKVMALAAYGKPVYADVFRRLFSLHEDGTYEIEPGSFPIESVARFWEKEKPFFLERALRIPPREPGARITKTYKDIAASMQLVSEEVVLHMARGLHRRTGMENLCLAGGVALNCLQNARMLREGPFKNVFVVPNASDSGDGMGAALYHYHHNLGGQRQWSMEMPYLGAGYTNREIENALTAASVHYSCPKDIASTAAKAISHGKVVGWFQGRAEAGPRALGNRSIVADPRDPKMRDYLNREIKHREWFRPFAPAVLVEKAREYFDCNGHFPYMLFAVPAKPERVKEIPSALHVDMTARVQTVRGRDNPLFRRLIEVFYEETGVPMILNTSFNGHGEPIVNSPSDAIRRFVDSKLDALAIGPFWIEKSDKFV